MNMKKYMAGALALLMPICFAAEKGTSPRRMGNQICTTFDRPPNVALEEGIHYYPDCADPDVKMDVYYPKAKAGEAAKQVPCVLVIHGGGWRMGNEKKWGMYSAFLASKGYVVACISYRLMPEYQMEDCVEDCKRALLYLRKNAAKWNGNPDKIGITGGSAGGHLSALVATSGGSGLFKEIFADGTSDKIQACVAMAPVMDLRPYVERWKLLGGEGNVERAWNLSPIKYVSKDSPPMMLLHSEREKGVPVAESESMIKAYADVGLKCEHIYYDSDIHAFWNTAIYDPFRLKSWEDSEKFFNKIFAGAFGE